MDLAPRPRHWSPENPGRGLTGLELVRATERYVGR